jgi:dCMP deaminase
MSWDARWLSQAEHSASWSKDRSRHVGAVIVRGDIDISKGWNGFPRKINDEVDERHERPLKYLWTEHAERNAIYNAAKHGFATDGCRIYQTLYPCAHCARAIIQSGIIEVITTEPDWNDPTYAEEFKVTKQMLAEASVSVRFLDL